MTSLVISAEHVEEFSASELIINNNAYLETLKTFLQKISYTSPVKPTEEDTDCCFENMNSFLYYFSMNFGFLKNFLENFISLKVTLDSFAVFSTQQVTLLSLAFGMLNLIMFYAFEVSLIRESLDIKASVAEDLELLHIYQEQLHVAKEINQVFFDIRNNKIERQDAQYSEQITFIKQMNQSFSAKIKEHTPLSFGKQVFKYFLFTMGAASSLVAEYFVSQYILQALSDVISLSPGIAIFLTSLWMLYTLINYAVLSGSSVLSLINPEYAKLKELHQDYHEFQRWATIPQ